MSKKINPKIIMSVNILLALISFQFYGQNAPSNLKYFGFAAIDCLYDDPLDSPVITNYINEVDSFSNIAHMCAFDFTDNIVSRTNLMNAHCVSPALQIQNIFFEIVDTLAPSGTNWNLRSDFVARWTTFLSINSSVLTPAKIGCFYIADEPFWNGISLAEMDTVCALLKNACPLIPIFMVEAYTTVNSMQVPQAMDWVGFDRYGVFDPQFDPAFTANLDTLKSRLSSPHQKIILIIDDQWYPDYLTYLGWPKDTMAYVVQNYYDLAAADTSIIGLIGYIWPGGLDSPTHNGVRNLTPLVINKNVQIGKLIKANYSPCNIVTGVQTNNFLNENVNIYPNPTNKNISITLPHNSKITNVKIYNLMGRLEMEVQELNTTNISIETTNLKSGIYFIKIECGMDVAIRKIIKLD